MKSIDADKINFENKIQSKMLSSIVKNQDSLLEEIKTIVKTPIPPKPKEIEADPENDFVKGEYVFENYDENR